MEFSNTLGQFINECINYKYSAESLEIEKGILQCDYNQHYIEALQFASFNISNYNNNFFSENMQELILEDISSNEISSAQNNITQTEQNIGSKILQTITNFFSKIFRFFKRIAANTFIKDDYKKLVMLVNNTTLDPVDQRRIAVAYKQATEKWNFTIEMPDNAKHDIDPRFDKSLIKVNNTDNEDDHQKEIDRANNELAIYNYAMNNIKVLFGTQIMVKYKDSMNCPISIEDLSSIIDAFESGITKEKDIIPILASIFKKYDSTVGVPPTVIIDLTSTSINDLSVRIESLIARLNKLKNDNVNIFKRQKINAISNYYKLLISYSGNLLKAIQQIVQTRNMMISLLKNIVSRYDIFNSKTSG